MEETLSFYLIYPLGLSELGLLELKEKWSMHFPSESLEILSVDEAGILISVKTLSGFALNHLLRSPTRILLRVAEFKARDFPKLFQKISKLPWKNLMIGGTPPVEASATNSRLFDSRKIEKAIHDGLNESYRKQPVKKKYLEHYEQNKTQDLPKIYYRAVDDVITISLDTTGEMLHKRGEKIFTGLAPIRENLAALLLSSLTKNLEGGNYTLIDPMSGSGTFLIEAHDRYKINFERPFAYQHTPLWIDYLQKKAFNESFKSKENAHFSKYLGFEINDDVLVLAKKNSDGKNISIQQGDVFSDKGFVMGDKNIVVINPPYGLRVGEKSHINLDYYKKIIESVRKKYDPVRLGIIIPEEYHYSPKSSELVFRLPFKNGGLPVIFYVLGF
jgi:putative N6-adenine-specific DNA methylase